MPGISKDGKTYTFTLKKTYRFSNGAKVTAANYAAAINRNLNPKMASPAQPFIEDIVGAQAVIDGQGHEGVGRQGALAVHAADQADEAGS